MTHILDSKDQFAMAATPKVVTHQIRGVEQYNAATKALALHGCGCHPQDVASALGKFSAAYLRLHRDGYRWGAYAAWAHTKPIKAIRVELTEAEASALEFALVEYYNHARGVDQ